MRVTYPVTETREAIARAIRVELASRNMSAAELARRTQMSDSYLSRRMTGGMPFSADDLTAIAGVLAVPIAQLLGAANNVPPGTPPPSPPPPPQPGPSPSGPGRAVAA